MKTFKKYLFEDEAMMKPLLAFTKKYIKAKDFITLSDFPEVQQFKKYDQKRKPGQYSLKPQGVWFGIGDSWINWLEYDMPSWAKGSVMKLTINPAKMYHIRKDKDVDKFSEQFAYKDETSKMWMGNWEAVAKKYDGIIHWMWPSGGGMDFNSPLGMWSGWDVPSGVVWNPRSIKKMEIIGRYDEEKKEYYRVGK